MPVLGARSDSLQEFFSDPALTVACVMLIVVSLGWVVISRLIVHNLKRAARRSQRARELVGEPRDIWSYPP